MNRFVEVLKMVLAVWTLAATLSACAEIMTAIAADGATTTTTNSMRAREASGGGGAFSFSFKRKQKQQLSLLGLRRTASPLLVPQRRPPCSREQDPVEMMMSMSSPSSMMMMIPRGGGLLSRRSSDKNKNALPVPDESSIPSASSPSKSSSVFPSASTNGSSSSGAATADTVSLLSSSKVPILARKHLYNPQRTLLTVVCLFTVYWLYDHRSVWLPFFNKDRIQQATLAWLDKLKDEPTGADNTYNKYKPLLLYMVGMATWELLGLSTIPVESAAGMAFGWPVLPYSLGGKLLGAGTAFLLARHVLAAVVGQRLQSNRIFQLVNAQPGSKSSSISTEAQESAASEDATFATAQHHHRHHPHPPVMTAFLMKFSCFPELVKNAGSALLPAVQPWMFFAATVIHGGMFTVLWTWLGVDTARQLVLQQQQQQDQAAVAASATSPSSSFWSWLGMEETSSSTSTDAITPTESTMAPATITPSSSSSSRGLQIALVGAALIGVVLTPLLMAWWVRDLKRLAAAAEQQKNEQQPQQEPALAM